MTSEEWALALIKDLGVKPDELAPWAVAAIIEFDGKAEQRGREAGRVEGIAEGRAQAFEEAAEIADNLYLCIDVCGELRKYDADVVAARIRARSKAGGVDYDGA